MKKIVWLTLVMFGLPGMAWSQSGAPGERDLTVFETERLEGPAITAFLRYELEQAWEQDDRRLDRIRAVRNESDLLALQTEIRKKLLDNIGGLPQSKTPLNARVLGTVRQPGYRVEKIVFESLPHYYVPALVWIPDRPASERMPAVLVPCGHSTNGKIYYQYICQRLAKRGYIALCWDPVGQGERSQFWDAAAGRTRYNLVCGEHAVLGNLAYLAGTNLARWEIWDGIRALDYLLTRPEVDPKRISITGTSGGGFQAAHIAALDDRIQVAAPSCYISSLPMRMANRTFRDPDSDPEQDLYRMVADGIDHSGLLLLVYPRPLILAAAVEDFFPIEGTRKTFHEVCALYRRLGKGDRIAMVEGYHKHQFSPGNLDVAFRFLDRFNGRPTSRGLESLEPLEEASLLCTGSGQVSTEFKDARSLVQLIGDYFHEQRNRRPSAKLVDLYRGDGYPGIGDWRVRQHEGKPAAAALEWEDRGAETKNGATIHRYVIHHSAGLEMPLIRISRGQGDARKVVLAFTLNGKVRPDDWPAVARLLDQGYEVVSFDFRGDGEQRMRYRTTSSDVAVVGEAGHANADAEYADPLNSVLANYVYNSLLIGRPYFLQMIEDVEIAARFTREVLGSKELALSSSGPGFTVAAAASECLPGVRLLASEGQDRVRWSAILDHGPEVWPIQFLLPGGGYIN